MRTHICFPVYKCHNTIHTLHIDQAGATVRLFHREYECYIAAEGSFAEEPSVVEEGRWSVIMMSPTIKFPE